MACRPGYKKEVGDEMIYCEQNLVGTHGVWYSEQYSQIASPLYCVQDLEYCPAILESAEYVVGRNDGRKLADVLWDAGRGR